MFIEKIKKTINEFNMFLNDDKKDINNIIVAISGGADSVSLLHALIYILKSEIININIFAAHVNHNLRGDESKNDEIFVTNLCKKMNIKLFKKSVMIQEDCDKYKFNKEEYSRNVRYDFFNNICEKIPNSKIATAHTLSDSIETVIFNLTRGTGLKGLCGINSKRDNIIRPLSNVTKQEVYFYLKKNNLNHIEDSSNSSLIYSRNKIRNIIVPVLKEINPSFEESFKSVIQRLIFDNDFLENATDIEFKKLKYNFDLDSIKKIPTNIQIRVIKKILEFLFKENKYNKNVEHKYVKLAMDLIEKSSGFFEVNSNFRVGILNNNIAIKKIKDNRNNRLTHDLKKFKINKVALCEFKKMEDRFSYKIGDYFSIIGDIKEYKFRNRLPGDKFTPLNRKYNKKLKKFLNEIKFCVIKRDELMILAHGSEVVWIDSVGISDKYKINENTKEIGIIVHENV